jgi:hypothetical protein
LRCLPLPLPYEGRGTQGVWASPEKVDTELRRSL